MLSFSPPWLICCPFLFWQASAKGTGFWFQLGCSFCLTVSTGIERVRHLHALLGICFGALAWVSQFCYLGNPATSPSLACCPCLAASGAWVQVLFLPWFKARNRWGMSYLPMLLAKLHSLVPGCLSWLEVHVPALSAYKLISLMNKLGCVIYIAFWCEKNCNLHIGYIALHKQVHCTPSSLLLWFRRKILIGRTSHVSLYFWCFILLTGNSGTLQPRLLVWRLWWRTRCSSLQVKLLQSCRVMKMLACQRTPTKHAPNSRQLLT